MSILAKFLGSVGVEAVGVLAQLFENAPAMKKGVVYVVSAA